MTFLLNSHSNATSRRWHLWEIDLGFSLNSIPGWTSTHLHIRTRATVYSSGPTCVTGSWKGKAQRVGHVRIGILARE